MWLNWEVRDKSIRPQLRYIFATYMCMRDICCLIRGFVSTHHIQLWLHDIEYHHDIDICYIYYDIFATNDTHG
jgi:hypothetical protein